MEVYEFDSLIHCTLYDVIKFYLMQNRDRAVDVGLRVSTAMHQRSTRIHKSEAFVCRLSKNLHLQRQALEVLPRGLDTVVSLVAVGTLAQASGTLATSLATNETQAVCGKTPHPYADGLSRSARGCRSAESWRSRSAGNARRTCRRARSRHGCRARSLPRRRARS